jgi:AcrR family transcriptional regulator
MAADTRAQILDAAHRLLNQRDATTLTVLEVAQASGFSRANIYKSIGSRASLLKAIFEDQGRLIQFDRVLVAIDMADPAEAILMTVRESCRAWSVMPNAIRRTLALAALDAEIGGLVAHYERLRRSRCAALAGRLAKARVMNRGLSVRDAATTIATLTSFTTYDQLRTDLDDRKATDFLAGLAATALGISRRD